MTDPRGTNMGEFEQGSLSAVYGQWDKVQELADHLERLEARHPGPEFTSRRFDEAKPAGPRGYVMADAYIGGALEHIHTIRHLFGGYGATPRVPWTLLRPVFEAGFWTIWLLEPDDGDVRRRRGLRAEVNAARERTNFYAAMFAHDPAQLTEATRNHGGHEQTYRVEAAALGMTWQQARQKINVVEELAKLNVVKTMEPALHDATNAMWRSLSGIQHGYAYALLLNSDLTGSEDIAGGVRATVTIREEAFLAAAGAASLLLIEGIALMIRRTTQL